MTSNETPDLGWTVIEMMGRRRVAGYAREVTIAGQGFIRLDLPTTEAGPGRTQYIAPSSVYAMHPVDEEIARVAARSLPEPPVARWELRNALPPAQPTTVDGPPDFDVDLEDDDSEDEDYYQ